MKKLIVCVLLAYVAVDYVQMKSKLRLVGQVYDVTKAKAYMDGLVDGISVFTKSMEEKEMKA